MIIIYRTGLFSRRFYSRLAVAIQLLCRELADKIEMLLHLGLGIVHIHVQALGKQIGTARGILHQQMAHDGVGCHLHQTTGHEIVQFLVACFFHGVRTSVELVGHLLHAVHVALVFRKHGLLLEITNGGDVCPIRHVTDGPPQSATGSYPRKWK